MMGKTITMPVESVEGRMAPSVSPRLEITSKRFGHAIIAFEIRYDQRLKMNH